MAKLRPVHFLAGFFWGNFAGIAWAVLFDLIPERVDNSLVGLMALIFFFMAMGVSMIAYNDKVVK